MPADPVEEQDEPPPEMGADPAPMSGAGSGRRRPRWWPERSADRYVGGVAGGIARSLDVDPFVTRVVVAVAVAYLPWLVALYALAWLALRDEVSGRSLLDEATEPGRRMPALGVMALGVGAVVLAPDLGPGGDTGLTVGVVLLAAGYLLVTGQVGGRGSGPGAAEAAGDAPGSLDGGPGPAGPAPPVPPAAGTWLRPRPLRLPRPPRPPRPPSHLGWMALSALAVLAGFAAVVDQAGSGVAPGVVVSGGLVLLGGVLCLAGWRGRARLLLPVGVALVPLWLALAASGVARYDGDGTARYTVAAGDPVPRAFRHGYGNLDVDLTGADFAAGEHRTVRVGLTAGRAEVRVPRDVHLEVRGDVGLGGVEVVDVWTVWDTGPSLLASVDRTLGDPQELCQEYPVPVDDLGDPGDVVEPGEPVDPVDPDADPASPPPTTVEHYHQRTGEPCTPEPEPDSDTPDEPAVLELVLDVGIGEVEIHRDEA